jgi:hypothetical protein
VKPIGEKAFGWISAARMISTKMNGIDSVASTAGECCPARWPTPLSAGQRSLARNKRTLIFSTPRSFKDGKSACADAVGCYQDPLTGSGREQSWPLSLSARMGRTPLTGARSQNRIRAVAESLFTVYWHSYRAQHERGGVIPMTPSPPTA